MRTAEVMLLAVGAGPTLDYADATAFLAEFEHIIERAKRRKLNWCITMGPAFPALIDDHVGKLCRFGFRSQATKVSAKGRVPAYCRPGCKQAAYFKQQREAAVLLPPSGASVKAADNLRRVVWDLLLLACLVSGDQSPSSDGPTKAERKAQEQRS